MNCTSSFSVRDPGTVPPSRRSFWKGSRTEIEGNGVGGVGTLCPDTPWPPGPYLHRPVDAEVMQQRVLHLGQNLAEELEYLLPHAWGVLGQEQSAHQRSGHIHLPEDSSPELLPGSVPPWSQLTGLLPLPVFGIGLPCVPNPFSCISFLHNWATIEHSTAGPPPPQVLHQWTVLNIYRHFSCY